MRLILFGPPGVGKGTQAEILKEKLKLIHIATGDVLRAALKEGTPLGLKAKAFMDKGELVPDGVIIGMIEEILSRPEAKTGYVLDGFPRTVPQAEALELLLESRHFHIDQVISLVVSEEEIVKRLAGRMTCAKCGTIYNKFNMPPKKEGLCDVCGSSEIVQRPDDKEETVRNRLNVYHQSTEQVLEFYRKKNKVTDVDADRPIETVTKEIIAIASKYSQE